MGALEWMLLICLSVLWGGSFIFNSLAIVHLDPVLIVTGRIVLAALILHVVRAARRLPMPRSLRLWSAFVLMGLLNNVIPFLLIAWGQTRIGAGLASILNATTPLFTVVVAHFVTDDEKLTGGRIIGVLVGLSGVVLIIGPSALGSLAEDTWGQLAVVTATLSYAFAGVFGRRFARQGIRPLVTATGQVTGSALVLVPIALLLELPWNGPVPPLSSVLAVAGLGVLSTAVAYLLYFRILSTAGATNVVLVTFLLPIVAILLGVMILGERVVPLHLIGMVVVCVGFAIIDGRLVRALERRLRGAKN